MSVGFVVPCVQQASLLLACSAGDVAVVASLLAEGVNPNYYDEVPCFVMCRW